MSRVYFIQEALNKVYADEFVINALLENYVYDGEEHKPTIDVVYMSTEEVLTSSDLSYYGLSLSVEWNTDDFINVTGIKTATITFKQINNNFIFLDSEDKEIPYPWVYTNTRSFEITPRTLTVTATDTTKYQGQADPSFTASATGQVEGQTPGYSGHLSRDPGEAAGTYSITKGNLALADNPEGNFLADNYTMYFVPGSLLINPAPDPDVPPGPPVPAP